MVLPNKKYIEEFNFIFIFFKVLTWAFKMWLKLFYVHFANPNLNLWSYSFYIYLKSLMSPSMKVLSLRLLITNAKWLLIFIPSCFTTVFLLTPFRKIERVCFIDRNVYRFEEYIKETYIGHSFYQEQNTLCFQLYMKPSSVHNRCKNF